MLVYRMYDTTLKQFLSYRVDPSRNKEEPTEVPQNLADMMYAMKIKREEEKKRKDELSIEVTYNVRVRCTF